MKKVFIGFLVVCVFFTLSADCNKEFFQCTKDCICEIGGPSECYLNNNCKKNCYSNWQQCLAMENSY